MKRIYLYSPYWNNMGGGESYMLHLALALSRLTETKVTIFSDSLQISKEKLEGFFGLNLSAIDYKSVKDGSRSLRNAVDDADVFIALSNYRRIKAEPKHFVQALQVPYGKINVRTIAAKISRGEVKEGLKDFWRLDLLSHAREKARLTVTNSQFVHDTLLTNFALESEVLHPPIHDFFEEGIKKAKDNPERGEVFQRALQHQTIRRPLCGF